MRDGLDCLLTRYEKGDITRRELLVMLATLVTAAPVAAAPEPAIGTVRQLNHATIFVRDVRKSVEFYQGMFDMAVLTPQPPGVNLKAGSGFLGIYPAQEQPTGINHLCFGLDNFDAEKVLNKLEGRSVKGRIRLRGDTKELYFTDPDNITVQLQDVSYRGGVGPLGNHDPR